MHYAPTTNLSVFCQNIDTNSKLLNYHMLSTLWNQWVQFGNVSENATVNIALPFGRWNYSHFHISSLDDKILFYRKLPLCSNLFYSQKKILFRSKALFYTEITNMAFCLNIFYEMFVYENYLYKF